MELKGKARVWDKILALGSIKTVIIHIGVDELTPGDIESEVNMGENVRGMRKNSFPKR